MLSHRPGRRFIGSSTLQALVLLVFGALLLLVTTTAPSCQALIPFIDGGKTMPKLYNCYFDSQLAKQASTAVGKAVAAGKTRIEVYFSPVYVVVPVRRSLSTVLLGRHTRMMISLVDSCLYYCLFLLVMHCCESSFMMGQQCTKSASMHLLNTTTGPTWMRFDSVRR
jgi:hypothetical protein